MNKATLANVIYSIGIILGCIPGIVCILAGAVVGVCMICFTAGIEIMCTHTTEKK